MKSKKAITLLVLTTLLLTLIPAIPMASAAVDTHYVTTGGSDEAAGTFAAPWATIQYAVDTVTAGDTIEVAAGTYAELVVIDKSLTLLGAKAGIDARTRITTTGESILDGTSYDVEHLAAFTILDGVTGVTIDGFEMKGYHLTTYAGGASGSAIVAYFGVHYVGTIGTSDISVLNNYMHDLGHNAILVGNEEGFTQSDWLVQYNRIEEFGYAGIELTNVIDSDVLDNKIVAPIAIVSDPGDAGSCIEISVRARADDTIVGGTNVLVEGNDITGTFPSGARAGINLLSRAYEATSIATLSGITINENNIGDLTNAEAGIVIEAQVKTTGGAATISNIDITGNTIEDNLGILVKTSADGVTVNYNDLLGTVGIDNIDDVNILDAEYNYWGSADEPTAKVAGLVDYEPWLGAEIGSGVAGFSIDYVTSGDVQYGDTLTVEGSGVTGGAVVELYWDAVKPWDGVSGLLNVTEGNPSGTFDLTIDVPSNLVGDHYLWAKDTNAEKTTMFGPITMVPKLKLSPSSGLPGDTVTLKGYGYGDEVKITLTSDFKDNPSFSPVEPETDELGYFKATVKVPTDQSEPVTVTITAKETVVTINTDTAEFKVGPSISLDVDEGPTGTEVEVTGRGFTKTAGTIISAATGITFGGIPCYLESDVTVRSDGTFKLKTFIPQVTSTKEYDLEVTDSALVTADAGFEVVGLAEIKVTPAYGPQGSTVIVEGWNFTQKVEDVVVTLDGKGEKTFETNSDGYFKGTYIVPAVASMTHEEGLKAEQIDYGIDATTDFRAGIMIVILSPTSGPTGTKVTLTGTGFSSGQAWNATFDDIEWVDEVTAEATEISATLYVPTIETGTHTVTVLDIEADIKVLVEFTVTDTTMIETNPIVAPQDYNVTISGKYFAADDNVDDVTLEWVLWNATEDWDMDVYYTHEVLDAKVDAEQFVDDEGNFTAWWNFNKGEIELSVGTYMINVTDSEGLYAQLEFNVVPKTVDIDSKKPVFRIEDTVAFNVESSFAMDDSYIKVWDPSDNLYWRTDAFTATDWLTVGTVSIVPYYEQVAGGNLMELLDDAPLGTWFWQWYDENAAKLDNGTFIVEAAPADLVAGMVDDLATDIDSLFDDMDSLSGQIGDVTDSFTDFEDQLSDLATLSENAATAAQQAAEAVTAVAATANTASEAASDAADAANDARDAATGLTTLVYGAIGASLVAALAAIVSLMQISKRIAG